MYVVRKSGLTPVHIIVVVCAVPFSSFDLFAAVVDKNDVTDQARSIKRAVSRKIEDFFLYRPGCPKGLFLAEKRILQVLRDPSYYTSCDQVVIVEVVDPSIDFA